MYKVGRYLEALELCVPFLLWQRRLHRALTLLRAYMPEL